jgi:uncharacterized membrane-anchored protein
MSISVAQESSDFLEQYSSLNWTSGPGAFDVTSHAKITLPADYDRLGASDTKKLMELMQNPSAGDEYYVGPEDSRWFAIFSYEDTGHIQDDEEIDAAALLKSLRAGTEIGNRERRRRGWAEMSIVGWQYEPYYDEDTNRLSWAVLAESEGIPIVNFNTRLLGRTGVISATLVADPETLDSSIAEFKSILGGFQYNSGETYAEYRPGDKLATYGLAALVTGGAAAAVAKGAGKGLFKAIGVAILALFAAIWGGVKKAFSRKNSV